MEQRFQHLGAPTNLIGAVPDEFDAVTFQEHIDIKVVLKRLQEHILFAKEKLCFRVTLYGYFERFSILQYATDLPIKMLLFYNDSDIECKRKCENPFTVAPFLCNLAVFSLFWRLRANFPRTI